MNLLIFMLAALARPGASRAEAHFHPTDRVRMVNGETIPTFPAIENPNSFKNGAKVR